MLSNNFQICFKKEKKEKHITCCFLIRFQLFSCIRDRFVCFSCFSVFPKQHPTLMLHEKKQKTKQNTTQFYPPFLNSQSTTPHPSYHKSQGYSGQFAVPSQGYDRDRQPFILTFTPTALYPNMACRRKLTYWGKNKVHSQQVDLNREPSI